MYNQHIYKRAKGGIEPGPPSTLKCRRQLNSQQRPYRHISLIRYFTVTFHEMSQSSNSTYEPTYRVTSKGENGTRPQWLQACVRTNFEHGKITECALCWTHQLQTQNAWPVVDCSMALIAGSSLEETPFAASLKDGSPLGVKGQSYFVFGYKTEGSRTNSVRIC